jgi:hypothetical protein
MRVTHAHGSNNTILLIAQFRLLYKEVNKSWLLTARSVTVTKKPPRRSPREQFLERGKRERGGKKTGKKQ